MIGELVAIAVAIGVAAAEAVLLVGPQHDADRCGADADSASSSAAALPTSPRTRRHRRSNRCRRPTNRSGRRSTTTSSGRSRPRISPTTLNESASGRNCASILSSSRSAVAAIDHTLQPVGVLGRDRGGRDLRDPFDVGQRAGVRRAQPGRSDGADQRGDRAECRGARRSPAAELHRLAVVGERDVEEDDLALDPAARRRRAPRSCGRSAARASTPSGGVPTLLPSPSITRSWTRGDDDLRDSRVPRTQCGTFTGSLRTFSRPSFFICSTAQSMASSSACDPLSRWPNVSPSSASRSQAWRDASASPTRRAAASRYGSSHECVRDADDCAMRDCDGPDRRTDRKSTNESNVGCA